MKLSAKAEYACLAMLQLATHYESNQLVQIRIIAETHGIPSRFLVQILLQLKGAGLVTSVRGAAGGYKLSLPPHAISLMDVIDVIEGNSSPIGNASEKTPFAEAILSLCLEMTDLQRNRLSNITLIEMVDKASSREPNYTI